MTRGPGKDPSVELGDVAEQEDISTADAADRLELDPEEQPNYPEAERSDPQQGGPPGASGREQRPG